MSKTLSIHIGLYAREFQVALIGPYHSYDLDCAVLQDDILTVLQDNMITQIKITDACIIRHVVLDCLGCNFAIYKFTIRENLICLYDFENNYYEIDFNGKHII